MTERPEIQRWLAANRAKKEAETELAKLRPVVISYLKQYGNLPDLEYITYSTTKLDGEKILEWVKRTYPQYVSRIVIEGFDEKEFEALVKADKIDISLLPTDCYTETAIEKLTPIKEKK